MVRVGGCGVGVVGGGGVSGGVGVVGFVGWCRYCWSYYWELVSFVLLLQGRPKKWYITSLGRMSKGCKNVAFRTGNRNRKKFLKGQEPDPTSKTLQLYSILPASFALLLCAS